MSFYVGYNYFPKLILFFLVFVICCLSFFEWPIESLFVSVSNILITAVSLFGVLFNKKPYSLRILFYFFNFLFFGISARIQVANNVVFWGGDELSYWSYGMANFLIIFSILTYELFYRIGIKSGNIIKYNSKARDSLQPRLRVVVVCFFLLVVACILVLKSKGFNVKNLFFREGSIVSSKMELLFYLYFISPMPFVLLGYVKYYFLDPKGSRRIAIVTLFIFLPIIIFFVSPISHARFFVFAMYLFLILTFSDVLNKNNRFIAVLLGSTFIVMPTLDLFRFSYDASSYSISTGFGYLITGNFDAYQNFVRVIETGFISYGWQLVGVLLFFIPRSIWIDKPIGSGHELAGMNDLVLSNISMPLIAEGYVNFGVVGSLLFIAIFSLLCGLLDNKYWRLHGDRTGANVFLRVFYTIFIGLSVFILRGDLMSSFAYTIGILFSVVFVGMVVKFIHRGRWVAKQ